MQKPNYSFGICIKIKFFVQNVWNFIFNLSINYDWLKGKENDLGRISHGFASKLKN